MAKQFMLMEPKNENFYQIMGGSNKYIVPRFQRDYAWDSAQWEDLWSDVVALDKEGFHYMGYIVLQQKDQYQYEVIDGQQRLVTLSIIILAAMKAIKNLIDKGDEVEENEERFRELSNSFVGSKNVISLRVISKLDLNRNNIKYYQKICSDLEAPNSRGTTATNKLLKKCFDFFCKKDFGKTGAEIAKFIIDFSTEMIFTKIVVQDDLNAYKVFETLNARGVQLSTPDLLKNYLFSVVTTDKDLEESELDELDEQWSEILSQLDDNNVSDYIRYHHNANKRMVTKSNLLLSMKRSIGEPADAYAYLKSLIKSAPIYTSLINPGDSWWGDQDAKYREARHYLDGIKLFNIRQPLTILLAAFPKFTPDEFVTLAKYLYVLSIRYNVVCHLSPSEQETSYNQIANKISNEKYKRSSHVKNGEEFKKLYPDDNTFFNSFEFHRMPSRQTAKKIRFLLSEVENFLGTGCDHDKTTLEHVCPFNPDQDWCEYFGEGVNDIKDRLGNMILLDKDELKRKSFKDKKFEYSSSRYKLAEKVAEYEEWNLEAVNDYQKWLARTATRVWAVIWN